MLLFPLLSPHSPSNAAAAAAAVTDASNLNPPPVVLVATLFDEVVMQLRSTILPAPASSCDRVPCFNNPNINPNPILNSRRLQSSTA